MSEDDDEGQFLTAGQVEAYGRFAGTPVVEDLERFFLLDDVDRKLVGQRRGAASRLGFALQLTTVRFLGTFLDDPLDVPALVLEYLAGQLEIRRPGVVRDYMMREMTRFEHRWEIQAADGWQEFTQVTDELTRWVDRRAWATGEGRKAVFDRAVPWLRQRRVLLPAVDSLTRLVGHVVGQAHLRLWETLLELVTAEQAMVLLGLVEVPDGQRISALERLRREPTGDTALALVRALSRAAEVTGIGLGGLDLSVVPQRRVVDLARAGMTANATSLRKRRPYAKRVATLLATVAYLEAKATDDALELFDVVMTSQLLARAERQSAKDQAKRYPRVSREASKLAAAVGVLLEATELDQQMPLERIWDLIESVVPRAELRAAVAPPGVDPEQEWQAALCARLPVARKFVRALAETVEFGATADAARVLIALQDLPALLDAKASKRVPTGYFDARLADVEVVPTGWRRHVFTEGRPPETVDRAGYTFCVLSQFHARLKRRDVFAAASSRWADPRAKLLAGEEWLAKRDVLLESLDLPEDPDELLAECATELDGRWRHMATRAVAGEVNVGADGRLHAAALKAVAAPDTLNALRERCQQMMPQVDIGDLVMEVMGWHPGFVAAYTHVGGGGARMDDLPTTLAAVLTAQALNVDWTAVISADVPALTRSRISHVYQNYVRAENHAAGNRWLIEGQAGSSTAAYWGGGLVAAVDGTRFVVPVRSLHARPNPKYFGRRKGATWLNLINDQGAGTAGMVVSGTARDSLNAVDLLYRRDGGRQPQVLISDTGSYTDMVFGLLKLLGVAYRPELADLPDQKLWRINPSADYGMLDGTARGRIDLGRVRQHWPDILRMVASVHSGAVSASDVMRMLQHGGQPTQLGQALAHFGRIFKTLHVLSYVDAESYRRAIKRMRNLQENRHGLAKYVFHGRRGELREAYHAGMEDQLGALGLVLNCITLWNTVYLDAILDQLRAEGFSVLDTDVARLSPYMYAHINVHGHYTFTAPDLGGTRRPLREPGAPTEE
jgi:TnpA family transposase